MASAAPPPVASTKETTNYARLCRLLVDVGSQALTDTFDGIHPPAGLHLVLARNPAHATLQTLRARRILNPTQWGKLYPTIPSSVSSASLDITLLMVLLRNICGLHAPVTGWDSLPPPADTSKEANIARVKYYRNTVYGHASQASVDDATFNTYWQDISNALVALGGASYGAAILKLKNECMDPDTEEHYRELLKQWKKDEDNIKDKLDEIEITLKNNQKELLKQLKEEKSDVKDKLGEIEGNIKVKLEQIGNQVKNVSEKLDSLTGSSQDEDKIRRDFEQMKSEIGNMSDKLDTLMAQREEIKEGDQARDDFQRMRIEIRNIAEKLNTQISSREIAKDEESIISKLDEMKDEIGNMEEKLDTLMSQTPPVEREPGMEDVFDPTEIIDGIRQLYKLREGWLAPFPWCEEFHFHLDDIFTRLKVVSRKKTRGTATTNTVNMSGIFKPHEECPQPKTVLIEGKPGMGKTTYCKKLVYDWATGKQEAENGYPRFEIVLLLRCRDMKSDLWEAIDDQLLPRDVEEDDKERFFNFIRHNQSNVLLILDGLDEVPVIKLPMFLEIIQGRVLPKCRLVATARHEAGIKVRIHCDTLLEIEGFTEEDAEKFVLKYFKTMEDLARKLLSRLENDKNLNEMAANPLNTALLCLVCEEFQGIFPESRAKLYLEIVQCVLRRYIQKKGISEDNGDLIEAYKPQLKHLGWIALKGLREGSLDFEESELGSHSADLPGFGFLSVQPGGSKLRPRRRYGFLHKSFQEWFAAFYLCCQLLKKEIRPDSLAADRRYFHELKEVLKFTSGMIAARCKKTTEALVKNLTTQVNHEDDDGCFYVLLECIRECKKENSDFHIKLARVSGSLLKRRALSLRRITDADAVVLAKALKGNSSLTELDLSDNNIGDQGATGLAEALKNNKSLTELGLSDNNIDDQGATGLAEALQNNKSLTELDLSVNNIGDQGATALAVALQKNKSLTELDLSVNNIGDQGATGLAEALQKNKSLTELDLSDNNIGVLGATGLAEAFQRNTCLTVLYLFSNNIGDQGAAALAEALQKNTSLTKFNLSVNNIGAVGATGLARALQENKSLTELYLSRNNIGDEGAAGLAAALQENKSLRKLYLYGNHISEACHSDTEHSGTVAQWKRSYCTRLRWNNGTVAQWDSDTVKLSNSDTNTVAKWDSGTPQNSEQWYSRKVVQWNKDTGHRWDGGAVVKWEKGAGLQWKSGTTEKCNSGSVEHSNSVAVTQRHSGKVRHRGTVIHGHSGEVELRNRTSEDQLHSRTENHWNYAQWNSGLVARRQNSMAEWRHSGAVAKWNGGTVKQCHSGTVERWHSGTVAQWKQWHSGTDSGTVAQWYSGTVEQWHSGTVPQWNGGTVAQWNSGTVETVEQWHSGTVEQWHSGTVAQWNSGTVAQWNSGTVEQWHSGTVVPASNQTNAESGQMTRHSSSSPPLHKTMRHGDSCADEAQFNGKSHPIAAVVAEVLNSLQRDGKSI
ncbi:hypothetical protein ACROYT_G029390 [Oculina patagonica]